MSQHLIGILYLATALGGLALIVWLAGKAFGNREQKGPAASVTPAPPGQAVAGAVQDVPGPVLAVIAAAVQTALQDEHFIIHGIRTVDPREGLAWSTEGRRSIYASKNLR